MFLLQINSNRLNNDLLQIQQLKVLKKNLINKINLLGATKEIKTLGLKLRKKNSLNKLVKYIVGISFLNTNINVYVTDIKGNIKCTLSAGSVEISGKQKRKKSIVLIKLLQYLIMHVRFIGKHPIVLHFKNFTDFYVSLALSILKKNFVIEIIKVYNNRPYNGCRPRKLKRKKYRKLKFVVKE